VKQFLLGDKGKKKREAERQGLHPRPKEELEYLRFVLDPTLA